MPLYVLVGPVAGGYVGLLTALRRETDNLLQGLAGHLGAVASRGLDRLDLPPAGVEPERLRRLAGQRLQPPRGGAVARVLAGFAVVRAVDAAGLGTLRERLLELADEAERRGERVVARDAASAVAREGFVGAVGSRLQLGWTATRALALGVAAGLLVSLPALSLLA